MILRFAVGVVLSNEPLTAALAISELAGTVALSGQFVALLLAFIVGRFFVRSRAVIFLVSFLGAAGAMVANMLVDGQGAFLFLGYAPFVYFAAVVGRRDLRAS